MTRYVIARQERGEFLAGPVVPVLDLPDAEHIHLHRRPDGTWTAVAMVDSGWRGKWDAILGRVLLPMVGAAVDYPLPLWADAPEQGDDPVHGDDPEDGAR